MGSLAGRVALVTGGSTGIGRSSALALAEAKAEVAITYLSSEAEAMAVVERIQGMGGKAIALKCDVTNLSDVQFTVQEVQTRLGRIDILVNNAGSAVRRCAFLESDDRLWKDTFELNLMGPVRCAKAVLPAMKKNRYGRIINISSIAPDHGGAATQSIHYACAKGALNTFTVGLALDVAAYGITVNAIAPGFVDTPFQVKTPGHNLEETAKQIPLGRVGIPEDISPLVAFLASDDASYITGEVYRVSGGR
jgi:3-oxoacyl-[acyl-carrier protein] reductase